MKHPFVKALTLVLFFGLIGGFVAYRSGYMLQSSPNGGALARPFPDSANKHLRMSSSKSIIMSEPAPRTLSVSGKNPGPFEPREPMMGGSKSAIIFEQPILKEGVGKPLVKDSVKAKP